MSVTSATGRLYKGLWGVLASYFLVPSTAPTLPASPGEAQDSFRPAEGFLKYLKMWFWIVLLLIDLAIVVALIIIFFINWIVGLILLIPALILIIVPDVIAYVAIHLRYDTTWYVMTDRTLRIRRGVLSIHETTITFENVQNVKVTQGPVQRAFGIANVIVETAGAGGSSGGQHGAGSVANQGIIEGVANAQALRDRILKKLRLSKSAGLGDDESEFTGNHSGTWRASHIQVLSEIRDITRALAGNG